MKKLGLLFVCILTMASCEKDGLTQEVSFDETIQNPEALVKQKSNSAKDGSNVAICHANNKIIFVNENALSAHIDHGDAVDLDGDGFFDKENSCSESLDCDDTNADVNPDAKEIYTDDIDNNCNGNIGKIVTDTSPADCIECTSGSGMYRNISTGKCKDFDTAPTGIKADRWKACTQEVETNVD